MLSSTVSGGSIPGIRRASMVFPEPGGPLRRMLIPNATHREGVHAIYLHVRISESAPEITVTVGD